MFLNGQRVKTGGDKGVNIKHFGDYVNMYLKQSDPRIHEVANDRWEFCISISDGQFNQVSFVNSICTNKGGTHVTHVADQIIAAILEKVNAKNKGGMEIKPFHVRNHLWVSGMHRSARELDMSPRKGQNQSKIAADFINIANVKVLVAVNVISAIIGEYRRYPSIL